MGGAILSSHSNRAHHDPDKIGAQGNEMEVDAVSNILNPMTAQTPSAFGMPVSGHALGTSTVCRTGIATSVVRDRKAVNGAVMGLTQGYFPGTSAWRPPNC
jgi:hypothetical protein